MNDFAEIIGITQITKVARTRLYQHVAIFLADGRVLSDETFSLIRIDGQEQINQTFELNLELHANTDPGATPTLHFEALLTRPVTIGIDLPSDKAAGAQDKDPQAFAKAIKGGSEDHLALWNGIVSHFAMGEPGVYHLTMRPALWTLGLTNRYQVHRQLSIRGLIESVLRDHGIIANGGAPLQNSVSLTAISGADNPAVTRVQDWLQVGESDLDFLQRITAKAHIYFYFEHHATYHRIIYANRAAYPDALPEGRKLRYAQTGTDPLGLEQDDLVVNYRFSQSMTSTGVDGFLTRQEAAWEQDTVARFDTYRARSAGQLGNLPFRRLQVYQYGGSDAEVRWDTQSCDQARKTAATALSASSTCPKLRPGYCFVLDDASTPEVQPLAIRPTLAGQRFVVNQVKHEADLDGHYGNQFEATEADGQLAGFSVADTQQGSVLAQVVKYDNGENPQDWRYYQRSAFDFVQDKLKDTTATPPLTRPQGVYVRFATDTADAPPVWIKLAAHMLTAPELGVTVVVARASDNSELPEIQSIVEANGHQTVTPSGWLANTSVGSNYSTSYGDSCSIRFGLNSPGDLATGQSWVDDKYQSGNSTVSGWFSGVHLRDVSWSQGGSSSYSQAENGRDDVLSESISVGSTYSQQQGKESKSISDLDYSYSSQTIGNSDSYQTVSGTSMSDSTVGISNSTSKTGISNSSQLVGISDSSQVTGASNSTQITGISINSQLTGVSAGVQATGISSNVQVTGVSTNLSATASSINLSATGISVSSQDTGVSTSTQLTGVSTNSQLTGISTSVSATGVSASTSATGVSSSLSATGASSSLSYTGASMDLSSVGARMSISNIGGIVDVTEYGGGVQVSNAAAVLGSELTGMTATIVGILKVIL